MTETEKIILLQEGAAYLARVWRRVEAPVSYERSHFVNGEWIKVTIAFDETRNGHRPARRAEDIDRDRQ
jgi:hypothetical protein